MSSAQADRPSKSPIISEIATDNNDGFSLTATIKEYTADSLGSLSLADRSLSNPDKFYKISGDQLNLNTVFTLDETDFTSILVINSDELLDQNSAQTGLAAVLIAVP